MALAFKPRPIISFWFSTSWLGDSIEVFQVNYENFSSGVRNEDGLFNLQISGEPE